MMAEPSTWPTAHRYFLTGTWDAWKLYRDLKGEQAFSGLKKVKGEIVNGQKRVLPDGVPDGLVFPMVSSLSRFVKKEKKGYGLCIPSRFPWPTLFTQPEMIFKTTAAHNPQTMGKAADCYVALHGVIDMYFAATQ